MACTLIPFDFKSWMHDSSTASQTNTFWMSTGILTMGGILRYLCVAATCKEKKKRENNAWNHMNKINRIHSQHLVADGIYENVFSSFLHYFSRFVLLSSWIYLLKTYRQILWKFINNIFLCVIFAVEPIQLRAYSPKRFAINWCCSAGDALFSFQKFYRQFCMVFFVYTSESTRTHMQACILMRDAERMWVPLFRMCLRKLYTAQLFKAR